MNLPVLYARSSSGKPLQWSVSTQDDKVIVVHGQVGGKLQTQTTVAKPKNIGKANATTGAEQATLEAQSKWNHQVKCEDYNADINMSGMQLRPMLALDYTKVAHRVRWKDVYVQPKLDGLRLTIGHRYEHTQGMDAMVEMMSRKGENYDIPHLFEPAVCLLNEVNRLLPQGFVCRALDGEAYKHGLSLQEIVGRCKKNRGAETEEIEFHVFDLVIDDMDFITRIQYLHEAYFSLILTVSDNIALVQAHECNHKDEMVEFHGIFAEQGYEGCMIRHGSSQYMAGGRSPDLFKYKEFKDMECIITGVWEDTNGNAMLTCRMKDGGVFECTPKRTHEERKKMLDKRADLIGQWITVKYQALTDGGLPSFPVGLEIRECNDAGEPIY